LPFSLDFHRSAQLPSKGLLHFKPSVFTRIRRTFWLFQTWLIHSLWLSLRRKIRSPSVERVRAALHRYLTVPSTLECLPQVPSGLFLVQPPPFSSIRSSLPAWLTPFFGATSSPTTAAGLFWPGRLLGQNLLPISPQVSSGLAASSDNLWDGSPLWPFAPPLRLLPHLLHSGCPHTRCVYRHPHQHPSFSLVDCFHPAFP